MKDYSRPQLGWRSGHKPPKLHFRIGTDADPFPVCGCDRQGGTIALTDDVDKVGCGNCKQSYPYKGAVAAKEGL